MKIAVLNINGIQVSEQGKKQFYYLVEDLYDFNGNSATDITNIDNLEFFYKLLRIDYCDFRESLNTLYLTLVYEELNDKEKILLSENFIVEKIKRDSFFSDDEQQENAIDMQNFLSKCVANKSVKKQAMLIALGDGGTEVRKASVFTGYKELNTEVKGLVNNSWHKIVLPSSVSPNSIIIVSCNTGKNGKYGGVREVGSVLDRKKKIDKNAAFTLNVKTNNENEIEVYSQDKKNVAFYISAQIG